MAFAAHSLDTLYSSLDPTSISQNLAFYQLYPSTQPGKQALQRAWSLLAGAEMSDSPSLQLPRINLQSIVALVTREPFAPPITLSDEELTLIEKISERLANRKKKGAHIWTREEVVAMDPKEIDLARGLLLNQYDDPIESKQAIRQYEASLDLMALQVMARLPQDASPEQKIHEINRLIFHELRFRFPPHSLMAKEVDLYTFLPSVLDTRQGVCLGVSIIYLCLAQRLDLPLEIITPPGHIYVRYRDGDDILNIETTARGIDLPSETYLGVNTRSLEEKNIKEVIGMAFVNQAAVAWQREEYPIAIKLYEKCLPYMPNDPLVSMFLGYNYLFVGKKTQGEKLLKKLQGFTFPYAVSPESTPDDYFSGKVDAEGIKAIFLPVDENRASITKKQQEIQKILNHYPRFRAGLLQLAVTWLQLGRSGEALEVLEKYHRIDPNYSVVEYYLSILSMERYDYPKAWKYLKNAEKLSLVKGHNSKALQRVRAELKRVCPEPS